MRIAVIEDDPVVSSAIRLNWPAPEDVTECFASYEDAWGALFARRSSPIDCVVLDMQDQDATLSEVLADIRRMSTIPVVMISDSEDGDFRAQMLLQGADDCLMKPLSVKELHVRIQRIMRPRGTVSASEAAPVMIGIIRFDAAARRLACPPCSEALTEAEAALLDALTFAQGRPVARDDLYKRAFGRTYNSGDKSLETYIGRLRRKLSILGEDGTRRILTARNVGYRINLLP